MNRTKVIATTLFLFLFVTSVILAQKEPGRGSVTVFSEEGENFTLYLNGDQKNSEPAKRVVADNITEIPVSFRIVFQNKSIPELTKKGIRGGTQCLYAISKNKKGERALKINGCTDEPSQPVADAIMPTNETLGTSPITSSAPEQLSASYANGVITINDGRTFTVQKVKVNGMTYPRLIMTALQGAKAFIAYDDNDEKYSAEIPFSYEVKDYANNNAYLTLTVDEGGPQRTWHVKLKNANGYDLKIE